MDIFDPVKVIGCWVKFLAGAITGLGNLVIDYNLVLLEDRWVFLCQVSKVLLPLAEDIVKLFPLCVKEEVGVIIILVLRIAILASELNSLSLYLAKFPRVLPRGVGS